MVYETSSNNFIIENTSDGYIDNVKLEGTTLVNLSDSMVTSLGGGGTREGKLITLPNKGYVSFKCTDMQLQNKQLTVKFFSSLEKNNNLRICIRYRKHDDTVEMITEYERTDIQTFVVPNIEYKYIIIYIQNIGVDTITQEYEVLCLEGDHTQNAPKYFKGLKSVGEDVDKIMVSSLKSSGNLLHCEDFSITKNGVTLTYDSSNQDFTLNGTCVENNTNFYLKSTVHNCSLLGTYSGRLILLNPSMEGRFHVRFSDKTYSRNVSLHNNRLTDTTTYNNGDVVTFSIRVDTGQTFNNDKFKICFNKGDTPISYEPYKEHKKELLYKDVDGIWKKPILCEWNTVEKHDDGKWYYHKRSKQIVLNGSENIKLYKSQKAQCITFEVSTEGIKFTGDQTVISNTFPYQHSGFNEKYDFESISNSGRYSNVYISILKSRLETQDVEGFKKWLKANNVTVVYQLAQEEIYECLPIPVASYKGETTYKVDSGVIAPTSTFELDYALSNAVGRISDVKAFNNAMIDNLKIILTDLSSKVE